MAGPVSEARIGVRVAPLAIDTATALGWATAFGICSISYYVLRGLFTFEQGTLGRVLGWFGGAGKWVQAKIEGAEQKVTHWVGQAAAGSEQRMADAFHASANVLQSIGHEIYGLSVDYWQVAQWVSHVAWVGLRGEELATRGWYRDRADRAHAAALERASRVHGRAISHADQPPIAAGIRVHTKPIGARTTWIDTRELPNIRARDRVRDHAIPQDQAGLRARTREAEGGLERLWDRVGHLSWATAGVGAVALVTVALGRLGAGWFRCTNVRNVGRRLCGMNPSQLEGLLAGTLAIVGTISIVDFAKELQALVDEGAGAIHGLIREK